MPKPPANRRNFDALVQIAKDLRGPDGCPWDLKQTHASLGRFALEEAHELVEAIEAGTPAEIRDELGDVLLQVVLHAEIARQAGHFAIEDVVQAIADKMVRRHPHVFADQHVGGADEVVRNWAEIKAAERANKPASSDPHAFEVPAALPALLRAHKIGEKTHSRSFDWDNADQCWDKVTEEIGELRDARAEGLAREEAELGDVLFSLAQWARHRGLDAERALRLGNRAFEDRYRRMREAVTADGRAFEDLPPEDKERYWKSAKQ